MIKLKNGAAFLATSSDTQTSHKVELMAVTYQAYLGTKDVDGETPQGYINSWVTDESNNNVFGSMKTQEDTEFSGNILFELTEAYIADLKVLNQSITFENTL
jgi:transcriptional antiterminator Rof (Rho-off)